MKIIICKDKADLGRKAGDAILSLVRKNPKAVLGLATGSSPLEIYARMAEGCRAGVSFKQVKSYNLDEYLSCPLEDQTYRYFMNENLFSKIDIDPKNTHFPDAGEPSEYDAEIEKAGGVDMQLLGIGRNGHVGFNEPSTPRDSKTHIVDLTPSTRQANARFFHNDINLVPTQAVTQGLGTIMKAKKIILVANDVSKALPVAYLLANKDSLEVPATILESHPDADIYLTEDVVEEARKIDL